MQGISAIIAIIMLLLITVALAGSAYVWMAGTTSSLTTSGTQATQQITAGMLSQMKVESAAGSKLYVRNTGKGTIENASLAVYVDDLRLGSSLSPVSLAENQVGELTLTGLWQLSLGKHTLKITTASLQLQQAVEAVPHSSAVGVWKMDEGSGTTASDSSGYGNTGTLYNGPLWTAGKFGNALQFDGVNDYVSVLDSNSLDFTNAITIAVWTYRDSSATGQWDFLIKENHFYFRLRHDPYYHPEIWLQLPSGFQRVFMAGNPIPRNEWHFVAFSYDGTWTKVYVDGNFIGQDNTYTGNMVPSSGILWINNMLAKGMIDEVKIYNKALTPDETVSLRMK